MTKILIFLLAFSISSIGFGTEVEFFGGATGTSFDKVSDASYTGVSTQFKFDFFNNNCGFYLDLDSRGSFWGSDLILGYDWRSSGAWFGEFGLGVGYSQIYGIYPSTVFGTGYKFGGKLYTNFVFLIVGQGLIFTPLIGYVF